MTGLLQTKLTSREELETLKDTYINGNIGEFREDLKKLNAHDVATLISLWQPYHSSIAAIKMQYEGKGYK